MAAPNLPWNNDAEQALKRVPFFARALVRRKVTERVAARGQAAVTLADFQEAEARFHSVTSGKSEQALKAMMPVENAQGAELLLVEACHHKLSNCPNALIDTDAWRIAVEQWAAHNNINERLRARVADDQILFHHKFRVAISACPNGCSRPQIADVGVMGAVRPDVDPGECTMCGACEEVCPDKAITVDNAPPLFDRTGCLGCNQCERICPQNAIVSSEPRARILAGGKLGRHPHLADVIGDAESPAELVDTLDWIVTDFIQNARAGERFADFWLRDQKARFFSPDRAKHAAESAARDRN